MKKIKLSQGKFVILDDSDFEYLNQWGWYFMPIGYAGRNMKIGKTKTVIYMHREIIKTPTGFVTDHINRDKLDNRRSNLRIVTRSQNGINTGLQSNNVSGYKGVSWHKKHKLWHTRIKKQNKEIHIGWFRVFGDAVFARKQAELIYHKI